MSVSVQFELILPSDVVNQLYLSPNFDAKFDLQFSPEGRILVIINDVLQLEFDHCIIDTMAKRIVFDGG